MTKDKKNSSDRINLILLKRIGVPIIDKTFDKNHLKSFLKKLTKIQRTQKIYKILDYEIKNFIHSVQILIN